MKSPLVPLQERLTEKFHALLGKCDLVANTAPLEETFDNLETFFIDDGRNFIQHVFQEKLQERIEHAQDNSSLICPDCKKKMTIQDNKSKNIIGLSSYRLVAKTFKLFLDFRLSPTTFFMLSLKQWEHELGTELKGFDGRRMINLEPEKWLGKELPLFPYFAETHEKNILKQGEWKLLLVHIVCEKCQEMIADLEKNESENIALAVIPVRSGERIPSMPFSAFVLDDRIDWFAETPRVIELSEGICVAIE
jgi:ssDNA-binding Zn-finger/Zn-ribbon topoisomerase 1